LDPWLGLAGFVVGIIIGLCGVGGGALMTPFLIHYGISPVIAVGTDLVYAFCSKSLGAWLHCRQNTVEWRLVFLLALGSVPSAILCLGILEVLASRGVDYQWLIRDIVGAALFVTGLVALLPLRRIRAGAMQRQSAGLSRPVAALTIFSGAVLGFAVTFSSIGSGAIGAAVLVLLYPLMPAVKVVGTDLMHAVPLVAIAASGHWKLGNVDMPLLLNLVLAALPGVWLGTRVGRCLSGTAVRRVLAVALLSVGLEMMLSRIS
jgi:uncharacterized membrane protein YfcA